VQIEPFSEVPLQKISNDFSRRQYSGRHPNVSKNYFKKIISAKLTTEWAYYYGIIEGLPYKVTCWQ
jgi:hypothetical protein